MQEAAYYEKVGEGLVRCRLCPHGCRLRPGQAGICRVRRNIKGELVTTNYARLTSLALDPMEKKPLYHFYPGSLILSAGTVGCNFRCDFCQNWTIAQEGEGRTEVVTAAELVAIARREGSIGIAYTYNEPTIWYEYVREAATRARAEGLVNVLVTNGFISPEPLEALLPVIDAMNIDVKSFREEYYRRVCKGERDAVLRTVERAAGRTHVEVTTLIVTGLNDSEAEMEALARWLAGVDRGIPLHLSRYFPNYRRETVATPPWTLQRLREIAAAHLDYVYLGNVVEADQNTYCPRCGALLIQRRYRGRVVGITARRCRQCRQEIPGVFSREESASDS